jgi:hypothetical protein
MKTEVVKMEKLIEVTIDPGTGMRYVPHLTVSPGDTVLLHAGSDIMSVWFPEPGVFATTEVVATQTGDIEVLIPSDATLGTYEYSIYVHNLPEPPEGSSRYTTSNSHPVMIVKNPGP